MGSLLTAGRTVPNTLVGSSLDLLLVLEFLRARKALSWEAQRSAALEGWDKKAGYLCADAGDSSSQSGH